MCTLRILSLNVGLYHNVAFGGGQNQPNWDMKFPRHGNKPASYAGQQLRGWVGSLHGLPI